MSRNRTVATCICLFWTYFSL